MKCALDIDACMDRGLEVVLGDKSTAEIFSHQWEHVCDESEMLVSSSVTGVNKELSNFSSIGGVLAHMINSCKYGYANGIMRSSLIQYDPICGVSTNVCSAPSV